MTRVKRAERTSRRQPLLSVVATPVIYKGPL